MALFRRGEKWKILILAVEEVQAGEDIMSKAYGNPLIMLLYFKYPGRLLSALEDDWPEVVTNLQKVQKNMAGYPVF